MSPLEALVAEVGRQRLFAALSEAFLRTGQVAETAGAVLVELRQTGEPAIVEVVSRHPRGALDAASAVLLYYARRSAAGGYRRAAP